MVYWTSCCLLIRYEGVSNYYTGGVNIPWMKIDSGVNIPCTIMFKKTYYTGIYYKVIHHEWDMNSQNSGDRHWLHRSNYMYHTNYHRLDVLGYWRIADIYCLFKVKVSLQFIYLYSNQLDDTINLSTHVTSHSKIWWQTLGDDRF